MNSLKFSGWAIGLCMLAASGSPLGSEINRNARAADVEALQELEAVWITEKCKYLTVYRKQADGSWKAVEDINNADTAPQ